MQCHYSKISTATAYALTPPLRPTTRLIRTSCRLALKLSLVSPLIKKRSLQGVVPHDGMLSKTTRVPVRNTPPRSRLVYTFWVLAASGCVGLLCEGMFGLSTSRSLRKPEMSVQCQYHNVKSVHAPVTLGPDDLSTLIASISTVLDQGQATRHTWFTARALPARVTGDEDICRVTQVRWITKRTMERGLGSTRT
jgi:hypothetical protein